MQKNMVKALSDALETSEKLAYGLEAQVENVMERKSLRTIGCNCRNARQRLDILARGNGMGSIVPLTGDRASTREAIEASPEFAGKLSKKVISKKG